MKQTVSVKKLIPLKILIMIKIIKNIFVLTLLLIGFQVNAQDVIWLSNTPPAYMSERVKTSGMHRLSTLKSGKRPDKSKRDKQKDKSKYQKPSADSTKSNDKKVQRSVAKSYRPATKYVQWLRKGSSVQNAQYICLNDSADYDLSLMSPEGRSVAIEMVKDKACYVKFELNEEGYYNAYLISKTPMGDTLHVNIAKAELLSHSCRNGHHKKLEARPVRTYPEITDFELIRLRKSYDNYHYFSSSGDDETYKVLFEEKPLTGVKLTINTEKGWSKTIYTNDKGEANVQFIQDYFSEWQELNRRKIYYYMLEADYTLKKETTYKGKSFGYIRYTLTMSDGYHPARTMYASMVWGLIVFLVVLVVSIIGVFIYKERRKRPYKEIKFDETSK